MAQYVRGGRAGHFCCARIPRWRILPLAVTLLLWGIRLRPQQGQIAEADLESLTPQTMAPTWLQLLTLLLFHCSARRGTFCCARISLSPRRRIRILPLDTLLLRHLGNGFPVFLPAYHSLDEVCPTLLDARRISAGGKGAGQSLTNLIGADELMDSYESLRERENSAARSVARPRLRAAARPRKWVRCFPKFAPTRPSRTRNLPLGRRRLAPRWS
jgi:hypothetical protein